MNIYWSRTPHFAIGIYLEWDDSPLREPDEPRCTLILNLGRRHVSIHWA